MRKSALGSSSIRRSPATFLIDDDDDDLDQLPLFQLSGKAGLTSDIVRGVERYLRGKSDETMRAGPVKRLIQNAEAIFKRNKS